MSMNTPPALWGGEAVLQVKYAPFRMDQYVAPRTCHPIAEQSRSQDGRGPGVTSGAALRGPGIRCPAPVIFIGALLLAWALNRRWYLPIEQATTGLVRISAGWLLIVAG